MARRRTLRDDPRWDSECGEKGTGGKDHESARSFRLTLRAPTSTGDDGSRFSQPYPSRFEASPWILSCRQRTGA